MQYELQIKDWRLMSTAPKTSQWIEAILKDGATARIHWAQDLSGEAQPAFSGWFYEKVNGGMFYEIFPEPVRWRPAHGEEASKEVGDAGIS